MDAVIDLVGGEVQDRSFSVLKPGGRLVSAVSVPDTGRAAEAGVDASFFLVAVSTERLNAISQSLARGELHTHVGTVLPLAAAGEAHEMLENLRPKPGGKIVLEVS